MGSCFKDEPQISDDTKHDRKMRFYKSLIKDDDSILNVMEDVIKRTGNTFGTNEAIILSQLALAAVPAAAIIFLDIVTNEVPSVCVTYNNTGSCINWVRDSRDICKMTNVTWEYVDAKASIISAYDLLCKPSWYLTLIRILFYVGMLLGCSITGLLSDHIGRKPVLMITLFGESVVTACLILSSSYVLWCFLRFLNGIFIGYFVVCKVLIIEGLKIKYRHAFLAAIWCSFAGGLLLLALLDYCFSSYNDVIACLVIILVFLWGLYLFGIEESLRWLLVKRKEEEATYLLGKISYRNQVDLPTYQDIPKPLDDEFTIIDIFKQSKSRHLIFVLMMLSILSFYLLVSYSSDFDTNFFSLLSVPVNLVLIGCLHIGGVGMSTVSCYYWGRRPTVSSLHVVAFCILVTAIVFLRVMIYVMISAMAIRCISAGLVYFCSLYSLEVFPTPFRAKAVGLVVAGSATGGLLSALCDLANSHTPAVLVLLVLQALAVMLASIFTFSLRETKGQPLPGQIQDMPQVLPFKEWCRCAAENPENHPLLPSPVFSHIHLNNLTKSGFMSPLETNNPILSGQEEETSSDEGDVRKEEDNKS